MNGFTPEEKRQIASEWFNWHNGKTDRSGMSEKQIIAKGMEIDDLYEQACNQGKREAKTKLTQYSNSGQIRCPSCGSTQFIGGHKGFGLGKATLGGVLLGPAGLLAGFIGSDQVTLSCLRCGNKWNAGT